jgi:hypothetical protein
MTTAANQIRKREAAIHRGLDFIYRFGSKPDNFDSYGSFLICCFALTGATSRDQRLRQVARQRAKQLARRWTRAHRFAPAEASADSIKDFVLVRYGLSRIGERSPVLSKQIGVAAGRFSALDLLGFDPLREPPPDDLSYRCDCGLKNQRGRKSCKQCKRRLLIKSRYKVWMDALTNTYVGERCGILFGARYVDVLNWLPKMRPYPVAGNEDDEIDEVLSDAIYAVTHLVYTLNDYSTYKLSPRWLPQEFTFLKANVEATCAHEDPELLGELIDSLKAFGLRATHPLIARGTGYLLASQNEDGSWGDPNEENIRIRCHTTWTVVDGLRAYAWRGERLSLPALKPLLKRKAITLNRNYS